MKPEGEFHLRVEQAMRRVHREQFVPPAQRAAASQDSALPIGWNQTVSQPSLVAFMTEELQLTEHSSVLEIGTGSGYQTAILAELAASVYTIERLVELGEIAQERLRGLGYRNIEFRIGDGAFGWPESAPFDAVIVTAAPRSLPPALVAQLKNGGRLVAPIGSCHLDDQVLILLEKNQEGHVTQRELCAVRFVPLVSDTQS